MRTHTKAGVAALLLVASLIGVTPGAQADTAVPDVRTGAFPGTFLSGDGDTVVTGVGSQAVIRVRRGDAWQQQGAVPIRAVDLLRDSPRHPFSIHGDDLGVLDATGVSFWQREGDTWSEVPSNIKVAPPLDLGSGLYHGGVAGIVVSNGLALVTLDPLRADAYLPVQQDYRAFGFVVLRKVDGLWITSAVAPFEVSSRTPPQTAFDGATISVSDERAGPNLTPANRVARYDAATGTITEDAFPYLFTQETPVTRGDDLWVMGADAALDPYGRTLNKLRHYRRVPTDPALGYRGVRSFRWEYVSTAPQNAPNFDKNGTLLLVGDTIYNGLDKGALIWRIRNGEAVFDRWALPEGVAGDLVPRDYYGDGGSRTRAVAGGQYLESIRIYEGPMSGHRYAIVQSPTYPLRAPQRDYPSTKKTKGLPFVGDGVPVGSIVTLERDGIAVATAPAVGDTWRLVDPGPITPGLHRYTVRASAGPTVLRSGPTRVNVTS